MSDVDEVTRFLARLVAAGTLPRVDRDVTRALIDETFRQQVDARLAGAGYQLLDNPYASHVGVGLIRELARDVFGKEDRWLSNTLGFNAQDVTLLVILWALLIIPKRMRQQGVDQASGGKTFAAAIARHQRSPEAVSIHTLLEDFGGRWKKSYLQSRLGLLARHDFIVRDRDTIREGPRLDLFLDYPLMVTRILEGVLGDFPKLMENNRIALDRRSLDSADEGRRDV